MEHPCPLPWRHSRPQTPFHQTYHFHNTPGFRRSSPSLLSTSSWLHAIPLQQTHPLQTNHPLYTRIRRPRVEQHNSLQLPPSTGVTVQMPSCDRQLLQTHPHSIASL
jgi:hypothetical protein